MNVSRRAVGRRLWRLGVLISISLAGIWLVFYFTQTALIFRTDSIMHTTPASRRWEYEDVRMRVGGESTHGWLVPVESPRGVVLYCHGNDGNISSRLGEIAYFRTLGFSVLVFDYGGFGESSGPPSEARMYDDTRAMWDYLVNARHVAPASIVIWGSSFGGSAACDLATQVTPGAVVLEATFTSMGEASFGRYGALLGTLFLRHRFENLRKVSSFTAPLLVIHSVEDTLYPIAHGRRLYEAAPQPKQFLEVAGDHGAGAGPKFAPGVNAFLDAYFPPSEAPEDTVLEPLLSKDAGEAKDVEADDDAPDDEHVDP